MTKNIGKYGIGTKQSHQRFEVLEKNINEAAEKNLYADEKSMAAILESVSKHNYNEFESTEWSVVFDQKNLSATYYHREHYGKNWKFNIF